MKGQLFVALTLLASAAFAQDDMRIISGKSNPELIPEWVALRQAMTVAATLDARYKDGAARYFARMAGISEDAARAIVAYHEELNEAALASPDERSPLCAKRSGLTTKEALIAELTELERAADERARTDFEGVYSVLSADDGAKLKAYAEEKKIGITRFGSTHAHLEKIGPVEYLNQLCGRK